MITKYKATTWAGYLIIRPVQVDRETDSNVWTDGRRIKKLSTNDGYFDTFDEAKDFLAEHAKRRIKSAEAALESARKFSDKVDGLKAP